MVNLWISFTRRRTTHTPTCHLREVIEIRRDPLQDAEKSRSINTDEFSLGIRVCTEIDHHPLTVFRLPKPVNTLAQSHDFGCHLTAEASVRTGLLMNRWHARRPVLLAQLTQPHWDLLRIG